MLDVLDSQKINCQGDTRPLCSLLLIKAKYVEGFFLEHYNFKICSSSLNVAMMWSVVLLLLVYWGPFLILPSSQLTHLLGPSWPQSLEKTYLYAHNLLFFSAFLSLLFSSHRSWTRDPFQAAPDLSSTILPFFLSLSASGAQEIPLIRACPNPSFFLKTMKDFTYKAKARSQIHRANQPPSQCAAFPPALPSFHTLLLPQSSFQMAQEHSSGNQHLWHMPASWKNVQHSGWCLSVFPIPV